TGKTLKSLCELFREKKAASVKIATLLDKPEGRKVDIEADYTCFINSAKKGMEPFKIPTKIGFFPA
ncbi:Hypoxanthine phosphoribosyltransferase, partial [human gut metagenome]